MKLHLDFIYSVLEAYYVKKVFQARHRFWVLSKIEVNRYAMKQHTAEKRVYGVSNFKNLSFVSIAKHFDVPISIAALTLGVHKF
jgi:hypothetical protein